MDAKKPPDPPDPEPFDYTPVLTVSLPKHDESDNVKMDTDPDSRKRHAASPPAIVVKPPKMPKSFTGRTTYTALDNPPYVVHVSKKDNDIKGTVLHHVKFGMFLANNNIFNTLTDGIKRLGRNRLAVEFKSHQDANSFLINPVLAKNDYIASIPQFNITRMGIVRDVPTEWSEEEIIKHVKVPTGCGPVIKARRMNRKVNNLGVTEWKPTQTVVLTFDGQILPKRVFCFCAALPVERYLFPTIQCYNCCRFGHTRTLCRSKPRCFKCGQDHPGDGCQTPPECAFCISCTGNHYANDNACPEMGRQKAIKALMAEKSMSYAEAEKQSKASKSILPLKKRLEKPIKQDDESTADKEKPNEKNVSEQSDQPDDTKQPKMETPLMYSYEITKNIEIVTIDEEERQKEHLETLKLRQHMSHVCENCALGFVLKKAYDVHMKVHAPESGEHECLLCHSRLKTADMLYRHRLRHYRRYRCLLCWMRFKDKDTAACHVMNDHSLGQAFECDRCGRGFKRPQYLKRHVEQYHTKPHRLECAVCFRVFHERGWYRAHIRTHDEEVRANTVRLPVTCEICFRDYKTKASLKRHLLTHDEDVHCDICYEKCKNRVTLGQHYLKVHNETYEGATQQMCPHCDRILVTRAMLKRHIQRMHSDRTKKYQCDHCQRLYLTKGEVRSHIVWSHLPAEARGGHACVCGRLFRSPSLLRDHTARFHAAQPPPRVHQCDHCDKAFANKQVLNRHKKSHSNEMYPCKECGLLFKTQPYVKVHYQLKHLNMTRAEIKAQRKLNRTKITYLHRSTNWEPPISNKNKKTVEMEAEQDPLLVRETEIEIKVEREELEVPTFETFIDISRN